MIFEVLKEKNFQRRICYIAKLSFRIKEEIKFPGKQELKEFIITKPALQEMLKRTLSRKETSSRSNKRRKHKTIKLIIALKISQRIHKIKGCKI